MRNNVNRASAVRTLATMKHTSHAGKNEPSTSTEGAREQPTSRGTGRRNPRTRLAEPMLRATLMSRASERSVESDLLPEKPGWLEPPELGHEQVRPPSEPARESAALRLRPADCVIQS